MVNYLSIYYQLCINGPFIVIVDLLQKGKSYVDI